MYCLISNENERLTEKDKVFKNYTFMELHITYTSQDREYENIFQ